MMLSDSEIYIHDHAKEIRTFFKDVLVLLHQPISMKEYIDAFALKIKEAYGASHHSYIVFLKNHFPVNEKLNDKMLFLKHGDIDPFLMSARVHRFATYKDVDETKLNPEIQKLIDDFLFSDFETFKSNATAKKALLNRHTAFGHQATLCHYISSNCVEMYRQVVPLDIKKRIELLLRLGLDINVAHNLYGGNCTLKELVETSAHPWEAGVIKDILGLL